jgi:hypothetical protein
MTTKVILLSASVVVIEPSLFKFLRSLMSLMVILKNSGFNTKLDRVFTGEALTKLTSFIRFAFSCEDVSIEEIMSSTGTLSGLKQNFGRFSSTDCPCIVKVLEEKLTTPGPRIDEGIIALFFDNFEKKFAICLWKGESHD